MSNIKCQMPNVMSYQCKMSNVMAHQMSNVILMSNVIFMSNVKYNRKTHSEDEDGLEIQKMRATRTSGKHR